MPRGAPPAACPGNPVIDTLSVGTLLYRVHSDVFGATAFNPTKADDPLKGGRFDSSDGSYAYLFAGQDFPTAIAETLVRDLPIGPTPPRIIPRVQLHRRMLSELRVDEPLALVSLHGADLGQVGQDPWLTKCSSSEYRETRTWAKAIRGWVPAAQGLVWRSYRDEDRFAYVLFADRIVTGALVEVSSIPADTGSGLLLVQQVLQRHNVVLA